MGTQPRRPGMPRKLAAFVLAALFGTGVALGAGGGSAVKLTAKLTAAQEVPKQSVTVTGGSGTFAATLSGRRLSWRLTFSGLSGPALAAHVHLGKAGVAGAVAVPLCGPCASGAHSATTVSAAVSAALLHGGAYVNVHTKKNPNGEIRGQVSADGATSAPAGAGTQPATTTSSGYGYGK